MKLKAHELSELQARLEMAEAQALSALHAAQRIREDFGIARARLDNMPNQYQMLAIRAICDAQGIPEKEFWKNLKCQKRVYIEARYLVVLFFRDMHRYQWARMGRWLKKDHATVMNAYDSANDLLITNEDFKKTYLDIKAKFLEVAL